MSGHQAVDVQSWREVSIVFGSVLEKLNANTDELKAVRLLLADVVTKPDLENMRLHIEGRMAQLAVTSDVDRKLADLSRDMDGKIAAVQREAVPTFIKRALGWVTIIGGAAGMISAAWVFIRSGGN